MLSRERKITLQRQEHKGKHNKQRITTIDAGSIRVWKENLQQQRRDHKRRKLR